MVRNIEEQISIMQNQFYLGPLPGNELANQLAGS